MLRERRQGLARVAGPHVGDVEHDPEDVELGVEVLARQRDDLERLLDPLQREVFGLGESSARSAAHQRVDGEKPERRRAVDQDHVVAALRFAQRVSQRQLAAHLPGEDQLRLGEPEICRDDAVVNRVDRLRWPVITSASVGCASGSASK